VSFEAVRFRYRPDLPEIHHGVSFVIPARGMTAFVGPSGAGKTTVFSMIERFYEPDSGRVLLDGKDVTDWPLTQLRAAIGYVEQDAPRAVRHPAREHHLRRATRRPQTNCTRCWPPPDSPA